MWTSNSGAIRRERPPLLDLDAIRRDHPIAGVIAAAIPLKRAGNDLVGLCPFHNERSASFTVVAGKGFFHCFGCGEHGDVLDFLQRLHGVGLRDAADMLCRGEVPTIETAAPWDNRDNRDNSLNLARAQSIWDAAVPATGTLADTYLRSRGLHLPLPDSIRFAWLPYGVRGPDHPVLVARVTAAAGEMIGVQRTYLAPDGAGKADVPKAKLSLGRVAGGAIRLAPPATELIVCEGLEDGLSLQQELGRGVWVAAGASMLPNMQFPPEVRSVAIGGDNDAQGRESASKAARAFALSDLTVRIFFPADPHKDFNEQLQKGARP